MQTALSNRADEKILLAFLQCLLLGVAIKNKKNALINKSRTIDLQSRGEIC